jgi:hypothetical protein
VREICRPQRWCDAPVATGGSAAGAVGVQRMEVGDGVTDVQLAVLMWSGSLGAWLGSQRVGQKHALTLVRCR